MANVIRYFPTTAINFAVKDSLQRTFVHGINPDKEKLKFFLGNLLSGGCAGSISLGIVYPLDYARTRLAADIHRTKGGKGGHGHHAPPPPPKTEAVGETIVKAGEKR